MTTQTTYGPRIKRLRTSKNEVQAELAAALDVSRSHITNIENGKDAASLETLAAIAEHYRISLDWLIRGVDGMEADTLTTQETDLITLYRALPIQARENVIKLFQVAANIAGIQ